jgi:hypothetical protein
MKRDEFLTADLYFAAYLQVAGAPYKRADRGPEGRVQFVFDATLVNIEELKTAWFNRSGKVPANDYAHAIKNLKSVCHTS